MGSITWLILTTSLLFRFIICRYEGRCGLPTNFDASYCYALGYGAGALLHSGKTGLISSVCFLLFLCLFATTQPLSFCSPPSGLTLIFHCAFKPNELLILFLHFIMSTGRKFGYPSWRMDCGRDCFDIINGCGEEAWYSNYSPHYPKQLCPSELSFSFPLSLYAGEEHS